MARDKLRIRYADNVRDQILRIALDQLAAGGPSAVSINAIARDMGVSGPALYRYVAGWDELITALIIDAYRDLGIAMAAAVATRRTPRSRLTACSNAYRAWAVAEPHRYRLLFQAPRPGYTFTEPELVSTSQTVMNLLIDVVGDDDRPRRGRVGGGIPDWLSRRGLPSELAHRAEVAVRLWARMHGLVSLEIEGCFAAMGLEIDHLYETEIRLAAA